MTNDANAAIDARIDAKLAALDGQLAALSAHRLTTESRLADLESASHVNAEMWFDCNRRLAALEPKPVPPEPTIKQRLQVRDGRFLLDGQPFTDFTANVAGNAIVSTTRQERRDIFKRLQDVGCQLVRLHHVAVDDRAPDKISEYQPTYDECRAAFPILIECLDDLDSLGMGAWINLQHRQRIDETTADRLGVRETLFGPRPSGIRQGEIHDSFFWFPSVREFVLGWMTEQGGLFGSHPGLWLVTLANEKLAVRSKGYWLGDRVNPGSQYQQAWFDLYDEYIACMVFPPTILGGGKQEVAKFQSWVGRLFFESTGAALRELFACPLGSSPLYGDSDMSALPEASCLDFTDLHVYPSSVSSLPDPFLPNDVRTIQSIANACRVVGKPLCLSEYAGIHEGQKVRLPSFYPCLDAVARAGFDVSCYYAWNLGKPRNNGLFDAGDDAEFVRWFQDAASEITESPSAGTQHHLSEADLFGQKIGPTYQPPPVPGTQPWAKEVSGVLLPEDTEWMK